MNISIGQKVTIIDAPTGKEVDGKIIKIYKDGFTMDHVSGVRFFATFNRLVNAAEYKREQGSLI